MPFWRKDTREEPWAQDALLDHVLTRELLDWTVAALTAVLSTEEMKADPLCRDAASLRDALKRVDYLYPAVLRRTYAEEADVPGDGTQGPVPDAGLDGAVPPPVPEV